MPIRLPVVGDTISGWAKGSSAMCTSPPVLATSGSHAALNANASWVGNKFTIADTGVMNYWYVPQGDANYGGISYCVVPCANKTQYAYVISDNYGGCEYHELWNAAFKTLAFIHVLRDGGTIRQYKIAPGWVRRSVKRSAPIVRAGGVTLGTNLSITCVDRSTPNPTVQTKFVRLANPQYGPTGVTLSIALEDDGDGPNIDAVDAIARMTNMRTRNRPGVRG